MIWKYITQFVSKYFSMLAFVSEYMLMYWIYLGMRESYICDLLNQI
jgi:hypothetical protein